MPTVVVVQSDELSAWIGIAGVAIGVLLTAGIDSLRKRAADRNNRHDILLDYGSNIVTLGVSLAEARDAAGANANQSPWAEMIATRKDALTVEYMKAVKALAPRPIRVGSKEADRAIALQEAATEMWAIWNEEPGPDTPLAEVKAAQHAALDKWFRLVERKHVVTDV